MPAVESALLTPVHAIETPDGSTEAYLSETDREAQGRCDTFRHSGWERRRELTKRALYEAYPTRTSMHSRFATCGTNAWVCEDEMNPGTYKIQCDRCRNRWCEACAKEKRFVIAANVKKNLPRCRLRFLTLTLKAVRGELKPQIERLYRSFKNFRNRSEIKKALHGGIAFLELTWNVDNRTWHPHLHVLFQGNYINKVTVKKHWLAVTNDSFIIDIREVPRPEYAVGYVTKYASKCLAASVINDHVAFKEAIIALRGVRTLFAWGCWKTWKLLAVDHTGHSWTPIRTLIDVLRDAARGDATSQQILRALKFNPNPSPCDVRPDDDDPGDDIDSC